MQSLVKRIDSLFMHTSLAPLARLQAVPKDAKRCACQSPGMGR